MGLRQAYGKQCILAQVCSALTTPCKPMLGPSVAGQVHVHGRSAVGPIQ